MPRKTIIIILVILILFVLCIVFTYLLLAPAVGEAYENIISGSIPTPDSSIVWQDDFEDGDSEGWLTCTGTTDSDYYKLLKEYDK